MGFSQHDAPPQERSARTREQAASLGIGDDAGSVR
jgi:hypothetical protein